MTAEPVDDGVPYVGYSNATLAALPWLDPGSNVTCPNCSAEHRLIVGEHLQFYICGQRTYLAGVGWRNVIGVPADVKGRIPNDNREEEDDAQQEAEVRPAADADHQGDQG